MVRAVAAKVSQQVGLEVVLLDSKLYSLICYKSTSILELWKSSHKIIAVPHTSYEKVVGNVPSKELSQTEDVVVSE